MKKGEQFQILGHTIKMCTNNDGIVLLSPKGIHLGNFGENVVSAKQYAVINYMLDQPSLRATMVSRIACSVIRGGHWGDYSLLIDAIKKDGLEIPNNIKMLDAMNRQIDFKLLNQ